MPPAGPHLHPRGYPDRAEPTPPRRVPVHDQLEHLQLPQVPRVLERRLEALQVQRLQLQDRGRQVAGRREVEVEAEPRADDVEAEPPPPAPPAGHPDGTPVLSSEVPTYGEDTPPTPAGPTFPSLRARLTVPLVAEKQRNVKGL